MSAIIIITILTVILLIFPLFTSAYIAIDKRQKTLKTEIVILGITVFKFNVKLKGFKLLIKQTFKKPYALSLTPKFKKPKNLPKIKHINVTSAETIVNCSVSGDFVLPLTLINTINTAKNVMLGIAMQKKPYFRSESNINVNLNGDNFTALVRLTAVFNIIDVLINLFINLSEKIRYAIRK